MTMLASRQHQVFLIYAFLMLVTSAMGFLKGILLAKLLGVSDFGYVSLAEVISSYGIYLLSLGLIHGLRREIPVMRANKRHLRLQWVLSNAMGHLLLHIGLCALVYAFVIVFLPLSTEVKQLLALSGGLSVAMTLFQYGTLQWNAEEHFVAYAASNALKSILVLVGAIVLGRLYGFQGAVFGEILGFSVVIFLMLCLRRYHAPRLSHWLQHLHWQEKRLGRYNPMARVNKIGMPLTAQAILRSSASNLDKIAVSMALGIAALGLYNFSVILTVVGLITTNLFGLYLSPKLCRWFAESGRFDYGKRVVHLSAWGLFLLGVACYAPFIWLLTPGMERFFPDFIEAIPLMQWMFWGALLQVFTLYDHLFSAAGRVAIYLKWNILFAVACLLTYASLALLQYPLITYPMAYVALRLVYAIAVILMSHLYIQSSSKLTQTRVGQAG